jgi:hypothetical protein
MLRDCERKTQACLQDLQGRYPPASFLGHKFFTPMLVEHLIKMAHMQGYHDGVEACTEELHYVRVANAGFAGRMQA